MKKIAEEEAKKRLEEEADNQSQLSVEAAEAAQEAGPESVVVPPQGESLPLEQVSSRIPSSLFLLSTIL